MALLRRPPKHRAEALAPLAEALAPLAVAVDDDETEKALNKISKAASAAKKIRAGTGDVVLCF